MNSRRLVLAASAAAIALSSGQAAFADDGQVTELDVLVVTAQKRSENIQEVPASVSAISGDRLQELNLDSLADYQAYIPGFNVSSNGSPGQGSVNLRGVSPVGPGAVVGFYLDDTPVGSSANYARATEFALDMGSYDLERLEVLRGPQGTLYGAGAMGGLVKYVLSAPNLDTFEARIGGDIASVNKAGDPEWGLRGAVNIPLIEDKLAVRITAFDRHVPGFIDNAFNGEKDVNDSRQHGGRIAALWEPTDTLSVKLNAMWQRTKSDNNSVVSMRSLTDVPNSDGAYIIKGSPNFGELTQRHAFDQPFTKDLDYYSATVNWDLGPVTAISSTSWSRTETLQVNDAPTFGLYYPLLTGGAIPAGVSRFDLSLDLDKFTQELRLVSPQGEKLEWIVGAYYTREVSKNRQEVFAYDNSFALIPAFSPYFATAALPSTYKEYAIFGDITYRFTDQFDVTVGVRRAKNKQNFRQISGGAILPVADDPGKSSESVTTWMASARYHVNEDVMFYARAATGYRPGGPNVILPGVPPSVSSDSLTNYEVGLKGEFLDRTVLFDLTAFFIDWKDIQLTTGSGGVSFLSNAGNAETKGLELESAWRPMEGLRIGLNAAYTDAKLKSVATGGPPVVLGYQLPGVPEWSASVTVDYGFDVADWRARVGGGLRHVGESYSGAPMLRSAGGTPSYLVPKYTSLDLNSSVSKDRLTLKFFIRNVTDERAYQGGGVLTDPFNAALQVDAAVMQPRTVGVGVDVSF